MKLAKSLERLGTESAFTVLAEAKKLEAQGKPMIHLGLGLDGLKNDIVLMLTLKEYLSCLVENQQCIMQFNVLVSQVQKLYILHQLFQFMSR